MQIVSHIPLCQKPSLPRVPRGPVSFTFTDTVAQSLKRVEQWSSLLDSCCEEDSEIDPDNHGEQRHDAMMTLSFSSARELCWTTVPRHNLPRKYKIKGIPGFIGYASAPDSFDEFFSSSLKIWFLWRSFVQVLLEEGFRLFVWLLLFFVVIFSFFLTKSSKIYS